MHVNEGRQVIFEKLAAMRSSKRLASHQGEVALKYVRVVQCVAEGDGVHVEMLGEDQESHRFDVSSECAGLLAASLAAEFEKLHGQEKDQQLIRPTGMQTARTAQGEPMILLALKGGGELPLVFRPESLSVLLSELEALMRPTQPQSQIRWR